MKQSIKKLDKAYSIKKVLQNVNSSNSIIVYYTVLNFYGENSQIK